MWVARVAVEQEALARGDLVETGAQHAIHHLVRHQHPALQELPGRAAEVAAGGDLRAQPLSRRDARKVEVLDEGGREGALARAGRTDQDQARGRAAQSLAVTLAQNLANHGAGRNFGCSSTT